LVEAADGGYFVMVCHVLWLWPTYVVSSVLNSLWYGDIAKTSWGLVAADRKSRVQHQGRMEQKMNEKHKEKHKEKEMEKGKGKEKESPDVRRQYTWIRPVRVSAPSEGGIEAPSRAVEGDASRYGGGGDGGGGGGGGSGGGLSWEPAGRQRNANQPISLDSAGRQLSANQPISGGGMFQDAAAEIYRVILVSIFFAQISAVTVFFPGGRGAAVRAVSSKPRKPLGSQLKPLT